MAEITADPEKGTLASIDPLKNETKQRSLWGDAWRTFRKHKPAIAGMVFTPLRADRGASIVFNGTEDTLVPYATASSQCAQSRDLGNRCLFVPFEGEGHLIGATHAAEIQEQTAHLLFEEVLWPLGYRAGRVDAAA